MSETPTPRLLLTPLEAAAALGIARSHLYVLLERGLIRSVQIGRCRRVPMAELQRYIAALADEAGFALTGPVDTSVRVDGRMSTPALV